MKRIILLLLAILLWGGTSLLHAQAEAPFLPSAADARCKQWVDSVFSGLNLQEKVGQLIVTTFPAKADKQKKKQIRDLVKKYKIGGLLFAEGTPEEQAILTNIAQKNSKVPVMITFDGEWGLSMRLEGTPYFPKNAALGCIEDNQLIYEYGREVAREFRELGVHVNFAPDADVNTNPLNPVIHVRSFGEDPKKVAEKVLAYSRGLESGGVLSVSKHFPGHGDTDVDSHKGLPVLYYNRERLDSVELYPFREMVRAGLGGVMVGHLQVPALEPDAKTASSLSRNVVTGLLKDEMGFQGLVFTDALDMKGVSSVPQLTTKALLAGNDMVLVQYNTANAVQEVLSAVKEGVLSEKEVEAKCRKILTYKYLLGLRQPRPQLQVSGMSYRIHTDEAKALVTRLRQASITVLGNHFGILPLTPVGGAPIALLSIGEGKDSVFVDEMKKLSPVPMECFRLTREMSEDGRRELARKLADYRRIVVSVSGKDADVVAYADFLAGLDLSVPLVYAFFTSYRGMQPLEPALNQASAVVLGHSSEADIQQYVAGALKAVGFTDVIEVAQGAMDTVSNEAHELIEKLEEGQKFMTTSCCPSYIELVNKHIPGMKPYVSGTGSPMYYAARIAKEKHPDAKVVFIGPCVAKRKEAQRDEAVDFVMTFEEVASVLDGLDIQLEQSQPYTMSFASVREAHGFAQAGGVMGAVKAYLKKEADKINAIQVANLDKKTIGSLRAYAKSGKAPGQFIEVMACEGGCITGPCTHNEIAAGKRQFVQELAKQEKTY